MLNYSLEHSLIRWENMRTVSQTFSIMEYLLLLTGKIAKRKVTIIGTNFPGKKLLQG